MVGGAHPANLKTRTTFGIDAGSLHRRSTDQVLEDLGLPHPGGAGTPRRLPGSDAEIEGNAGDELRGKPGIRPRGANLGQRVGTAAAGERRGGERHNSRPGELDSGNVAE